MIRSLENGRSGKVCANFRHQTRYHGLEGSRRGGGASLIVSISPEG